MTDTDTIHIPPRADGPTLDAVHKGAGRSILSAFLKQAKATPNAVALEDGDKRVLTYKDLTRAIAAFSRVIRRRIAGDTVGVLLPSSAGAAIAYFATLAAGKTPAMLNFTAGPAAITAACRIAGIDGVLSAHRFVEVAKAEALVEAIGAEAPVLMLEDLRKEVSTLDKAFAAAAGPLSLFPRHDPDAAAAIVFTSGSEGDPKAVVLTHRNFLANAIQIEAALPVERARIFFNPLPVFHSYGLGPGMILPLVTGRKVVFHPSPLRAREVAERIHDTQANILLATDTFLRQYARAGDPGSLSSLHFAVCGAERVRPETRELVHSRYGFRVLEGYGVTETAPVLSANHPDDIRDGTVGPLFPALEAKLVPVEGLDDGKKLLVRGPNVMAGYLDPATRKVVPLPDGWHDTGDIVALEDGFLVIKGRLKRFAKIGGEMTSLVTVENLAGKVWPQSLHAAAAVPGVRRGEMIVLLTEEENPEPEALHAQMKADGVPERFLPTRIIPVPAVPVLGTGKTDFVGATKMARRLTEDMRAA
ncbi:MAG: AMP-binding protein [Pseudomonadota bacterium]